MYSLCTGLPQQYLLVEHIFYIRYNYMFRRLIMAIFRLYMKYLLRSLTYIHGLFIWGWKGVKWARDLVSVRMFGRCGHYQGPKHVVVLYVENTLYSTNKYSCVRRVHTFYISYFIENNRDGEPHDYTLLEKCYTFRIN